MKTTKSSQLVTGTHQRGLIPKGKVDIRSIRDVQSEDLEGFTQCHFFAGIGGWNLALQLAGWPEDRPVWTGSCPASLSQILEKGKERLMIETSGRPLCGSLPKRRPCNIFGEQVAAAIRSNWLDRISSNRKRSVYPLGRLYWEHIASVRHISENDCIGSHRWMTPEARMYRDLSSKGRYILPQERGILCQLCAKPTTVDSRHNRFHSF
jgi:hypothetical protein